jgi:hypothetical protein
MMANDAQPLAVQEVDVAQQLLAQQRVRPHQPQLGVVERTRLLEDVVRDRDLADVVQEEAVLDARVAEQRGLDRLRQLDRVPLHPLRVGRGSRVLRLEHPGERGHGLLVRAPEQRLAAALDLQQAAQVVRVAEQLLPRGRRRGRFERPR